MSDVRGLEADYERTKFRHAQPLRDLALEHPSLPLASASFSRDDKHKAGIACGRGPQETQKRRVCFTLGQAVQIEPTVDRLFTASDPSAHAAPERRMWRWSFVACRRRLRRFCRRYFDLRGDIFRRLGVF
jgi:hypothetical protein